ncbi:MAG TPA: hypothetical protein VFQ61_26365, partial [Polyangiaceae bacterium]|nr:hypothetical protein [Polyangiaceae bacterium]
VVQDGVMRFKLAKNLCESNYRKKKILALEATAACPSKRLFQPLCTDYTAPDPRTRDDAPQTGTCTIANLDAVESAVYVLLDRSRSMNKFYEGNDMALTLKSTVGLPLSTPVAERTKVGFEFLPPTAAQCSNLDYENPRVAIGEVTQARDAIVGLLDGDAVLADNPSSFFLQAALQGAYASVGAVRASGQRFNRRAVVVVSNRDILNGQCSSVPAIELARAARNRADPVFTYAVALDDGEDAALSSATELAQAGGTRVIDGVSNEEDGARAVQDILTELGTCLYDVKRADAGGSARLPKTAKVAYIDVDRSTDSGTGESSRGIEIEYAEGCVDASSSVSGWNQGEDGLLRLCGQACEDLRRVVGNSAVTQLVQGRPAPAVPLVVTAPCSEYEVGRE